MKKIPFISHKEGRALVMEIDRICKIVFDAILACIAMSLLFCILGCEIWWDWVAKMGEKNREVLVCGE